MLFVISVHKGLTFYDPLGTDRLLLAISKLHSLTFPKMPNLTQVFLFMGDLPSPVRSLTHDH